MLGTPLGRILLDRPAWTYLLGPFFKAATPDQAAPLSATYREAGAVGALTITDTGNNLSVSGGKVRPAAGTGTWGNPGLDGAGLSRVAGRTLFASIKTSSVVGNWMLGWAASAGSGPAFEHAAHFQSTSVLNYRRTGGVTLSVGGTFSDTATEFAFAVMLRSTGALLLVRGGSFTAWTVLWVDNAGTVATLYPGYHHLDQSATLANLRVADLGGAFATAYGLATDRKATSAATDTITHTANCLIEHTITAATGVTQELWVRRTDANNGWIVRMDQAGSTIKLIEMVAGVETERASTAQTWTNGVAYRVVVICDGTTITPYVANVAKTGYASASTNQSATTAYVSDAGVDFCSWPRVVSLPSGI